MRKQLTGLFSAAALALVVSCAGSDDNAIKMPAPINIEPGVYTIGTELGKSEARTGMWKDGEPFPFIDADGNPYHDVIDYHVTPGYIYVLAFDTKLQSIGCK